MGRAQEHVEVTTPVPESLEALHRMSSEQRRALLLQYAEQGKLPTLRAVDDAEH